MKKVILLSIIFTFYITPCFPQKNKVPEITKDLKLIFKLYPTFISNLGFGIGNEFKFSNNSIELTYIYTPKNYITKWDRFSRNYNFQYPIIFSEKNIGNAIRLSYKRFYGDDEDRDFIGIMLMYKLIKVEEKKLMSFKYNRFDDILSVNLIYGLENVNHFLSYEIYCGIGVKWNHYSVDTYELVYATKTYNYSYTRYNKLVYPNILLGFNFGKPIKL